MMPHIFRSPLWRAGTNNGWHTVTYSTYGNRPLGFWAGAALSASALTRSWSRGYRRSAMAIS